MKPLRFIHIPKNAGSSIEEAGRALAYNGANMIARSDDPSCPVQMPTETTRRCSICLGRTFQPSCVSALSPNRIGLPWFATRNNAWCQSSFADLATDGTGIPNA